MPSTAPILLVVDDDEDVRQMLKLVLEDEGFVVIEAENGKVALEKLTNGLRPQLIILDLMMPVMNGWDFRDQQKVTPELADIPVVIFTASGLTTGAVGDATILPKPVDAAVLIETLRELSGRPL